MRKTERNGLVRAGRIRIPMILLLIALVSVSALIEAPQRPNVLYIVSDDLRNELGFTNSHAGLVTPHLDALAKESLVFDRMYAQQAICSPSRNSFMVGRRPDATKVWNFIQSFRDSLGNSVTTIPQAFKEAGYVTTGMGKIYHKNRPMADDCPDPDSEAEGGCLSWSTDYPYFQGPNAKQTLDCRYEANVTSGQGRWQACDAPDTNFIDGLTTEVALQRLEDLKSREDDKPFFMAVGMSKPHAPWHMPLEFLEQQLPEEDTDLPVHRTRPIDAHDISLYHCSNVGPPNNYTVDIPLNDVGTRQARRAYRGVVTFMDHLVGKILSKLDEVGFSENTIVVFHSDHGWSLGENGQWCKESNHEIVARVPFMIRVPWLNQGVGSRTSQLSELVDLFPTLLELTGLEIKDQNMLDGQSLVSLFSEPNSPLTPAKTASYSQFPRCDGSKYLDVDSKNKSIVNPKIVSPWLRSTDNGCGKTEPEDIRAMGYSIRTDEFRYTVWVKWDGDTLLPLWDQEIAEELYDHRGDTGMNPDLFEYRNIASHPSLQTLRTQLKSRVVEFYKNPQHPSAVA